MKLSWFSIIVRQTFPVFYLYLLLSFPLYATEDIQFNTDVLSVRDKKNIDVSPFSRGGYIMPGRYDMTVRINKTTLPEQMILFYSPGADPHESRVCLSPELVGKLGLKADMLNQLTWWHQEECLDENSLPGMSVRADLPTFSLYLNIPQAYLEYTDANWEPPSRWDDGIPGLLFDYKFNARSRQGNDKTDYGISGNGTTGANLGAWRFRAEWQTNTEHSSDHYQARRNTLNWDRYYAYRALPAIHSKLTLGENYLDSGMFDSFRFTGASLVSDDNMLPPNVRGYAPEVEGVAKTNARVVISQQGRVLYETTVAAGPFRIQDINDAVRGELHVRVEEQDGSVQEFMINTASIPFLTRPGTVRFKLAAGKPMDWAHHVRSLLFGTGEFSWGISNGWSLFGGGLNGGDYQALSLGIGRDLMVLGALSFDATQSWGRLPQQDNMLTGGSYRVSYSKRFDEYESQITVAGYRFSERNFMSMNDYLDARYYGNQIIGSGKEQYTISFNKNFSDWSTSTYLNYDHQTYWDRPANDRYSFMLSHSFELGQLRALSLSLTAYRNRYNGVNNDEGAYLSLSIPWGEHATTSYSASFNRRNSTHSLSYYDWVDDRNAYQLSAGQSQSGINTSAYYTHEGNFSHLTANASYQEGLYSAVGLGAQGGVTITPEGGAVHRSSMGGARLLVDTSGVAGIPVRGYGRTVNTNAWGKAVVSDVSNYYPNKVTIDLNAMNGNAEATKSVVQATLTEGAIGYREFDLIAGDKATAVIKLADGSEPPFGALVFNARKQEAGIINDGGSVYLIGLRASDILTVHWNGAARCEVHLPTSLPADMLMNTLLLPCRALTRNTG